jgi:glutamate 5-kinase
MEKPIVVLKVGTSSVVDPTNQNVKVSALARLAEASVRLMESGCSVILVSSGAVGLGCARLGLKEKPTTIAGKQAAAAVGQVRLMSLYDDVFSILHHRCAQVLLTYDTFGERMQYLNARNTFFELLARGVVPIVNENDTVAVQEIRVGDNDTLSALVATMVGAKLLFLLTDVEALFDANPRVVPTASPIRVVPASKIQWLRKQMVEGSALMSLEGEPAAAEAPKSKTGTASVAVAGSAFGTGGMVTKLKAAHLATAAGVTVVITNTDRVEKVDATIAGVLTRSGADVSRTDVVHIPPTLFVDLGIGTSFLPSHKPVTGRKRWILSLAPSGVLVLDNGAVSALVDARKSLFPAGLASVQGCFEAQDAVQVMDARGHEVARALVNYSSDDCLKIKGKRSKDLGDVLGYLGSETVADRDNIVILKDKEKEIAHDTARIIT